MRIQVFFFFFALFLTAKVTAQQTGCSSGKLDMQQLRLWAQPPAQPFRFTRITRSVLRPVTPILYKEKDTAASTVFLPQWTPADLPVFCRIEHEIGKKMPMMIKFRLGSVEYVDWLEGK